MGYNVPMPHNPEKHDSYITMAKIGLDAYMEGMLSLGVRWKDRYKEPNIHFLSHAHYRLPNKNKQKGPIHTQGYYQDGDIYILRTDKNSTKERPQADQFTTLFHEEGHAALDLPVTTPSLTLFGKHVERSGYLLQVGEKNGREYMRGFNEATAEKMGEYFYKLASKNGSPLPEYAQNAKFGIARTSASEENEKNEYATYFSFWNFFVERLAEKKQWDIQKTQEYILRSSIHQNIQWLQDLENLFGTHALSMLALMGADLHPSGFDSEPLATKEYRTWYITKFFSSDQTLRQSYPLEQFPDLQTPDQIRTYLVQQALKDIPDHIVDELLNEVPAMIKVMFSKDPVTHYLYSPYPKEQTPRRRGRIENLIGTLFSRK